MSHIILYIHKIKIICPLTNELIILVSSNIKNETLK